MTSTDPHVENHAVRQRSQHALVQWSRPPPSASWVCALMDDELSRVAGQVHVQQNAAANAANTSAFIGAGHRHMA
jgi:hypothetical protein